MEWTGYRARGKGSVFQMRTFTFWYGPRAVSIIKRLRDGAGLIPQPLLSPQALSSPAMHTAFEGCAVFGGMQRNTGGMMTENPEPFLDEFRPQVGRLGSKCSQEETRVSASMSSTI